MHLEGIFQNGLAGLFNIRNVYVQLFFSLNLSNTDGTLDGLAKILYKYIQI